MIQFNKTIFQFTKRLALVVMLIGISSAAWASNAKGYSRVEAKATINGEDVTSEGTGNNAVYKVYVSTTDLGETGATDTHYKEAENTVNTPWNDVIGAERKTILWNSYIGEKTEQATYTNTAASKIVIYDEWFGNEDDANRFVDALEHTYYLHAKNQEGYLFLGWFDDTNDTLSTELNFSYTIDAPALQPDTIHDWYTKDTTINGTTGSVQHYHYVFNPYSLSAEARWVLPIVTKVDGEDGKNNILSRTVTISDPSLTTHTENVVFTLSQDQAADNYTLTATDVPIDTIEYTKGQYTVSVNYAVTGQHGKETTYVITLRSNFNGGVAGAETFKTCSLTIKENYAPTFEITPNSYTFIKDVQRSNDADNPVTFEITENTTAQHSNTQWSWQIIGEDEEFFSMTPNETTKFVDNKPTDIVITFNRGESQKSKFEAKLAITCKYSSVASGEAPTYTQYVNLTATFEPTIQFEGKTAHSLDLGTIICGTPIAEEVDHAYYYLGDGVTPVLTKVSGNDEIGVAFAEGNTNKVNVTMANTVMPGAYTTTWKSTIPGDTDDDPKAELTVNAKVELATPVLTAVPANAEVNLEWSEIYGATKYYITTEVPTFNATDGTLTIDELDINTAKEKIYVTDNSTITNYTHELTSNDNGKTFYYYVTAVYEKDGKVIDAKTSNLATARPDNIPQTITYDVADILELYTGTEKGGDNFPYKTKRRIDVRAAFNADGNALMDRLYIYGLTTASDNGDVINYTNASTPCYIYDKTNPTTYTLTTINAADRNVNTPNKLDGFTITPSDKLKNLYFTGYCPFATCGTTSWTDNAIMHIQGSGEVHIYIDNLQLYARSKDNATYILPASAILSFGEQATVGNYAYPGGSGAVFAFSANNTETPLTPYIHVYNSDNENILDATNGMKLTAGKDLTLTPNGPYAQYSSPIQILPMMIGTYNDENVGINAKVNLTITDEWNGEHTNGVLRLTETSGGTGNNSWKETNNVPSIDLGYAGNTINIAGGQLYLKQGTSSAMEYVSKLITGKVSTQSLSITLYGMQPTGFTPSTNGTVCFKDGTVNNVAGNTNALVCPANTTIDGGSFNCNITRGNDDNGDPLPIYNSFDNTKALKLLDIDVTDYIQEGKVVITDHDAFMDDIFPLANYLNANTSKYESLSGYYQEKGKGYGLTSLTPEGNVVHLMLHQKGTPTINEWAIAGRNVNILKNTENVMTLEGQVRCVDQVEGDEGLFGQTYKMLYMEKDAFGYLDNAGNEYQIDNGYSVSYGDNTYEIQPQNTQTTIINTKQYTIKEKVYMLKPLVAAKWMLFTPPFDVANVYIIESYPEEQLVKDYSEGNPNKIITGQYIREARQAQAQRTMDLYMAWYGGRESSKDFFESEFLTQWMTYESARGKDGAAPAEGSNYMPIIGKLCNFVGKDNSLYPDGMKWWNANYYIYKSTDDWTFDQTAANFGTKWALVETLPDQTDTDGKQLPIMEAGETYAIEFPYNVGGHDPNAMWDYWTGKYILIESTEGPHTILGSDFAMVNGATASDGSAFLWGNSTFASCTIPDTYKSNAWVMEKCSISSGDIDLGDGQIATVTKYESKFVSATEQAQLELLPTENFLLANFKAPAQTRARSINYRTGEVTYEKIDDNNPGLGSGIPTIMGDLTLMVVPTPEGLTITPLKEQHVMLFDAEGKMIFSKYMSEEENVSLPTGVYVVRGEYEQVKAIKK